MYLDMQQTYVSRGPAVTEHVYQRTATTLMLINRVRDQHSNNHHALSHDTVAQGVQEHSSMGDAVTRT